MSNIWTTGYSGVHTDGLSHHHTLEEGDDDGKDDCQVGGILDHSSPLANWSYGLPTPLYMDLLCY